MTERFIKNDLTLKRWRVFRANRLSRISLQAVLLFIALSLTAEFWANSKPLILFHGGKLFFPVVRDYSPSRFQRADAPQKHASAFVMDYKTLSLKEGDWALWPPVRWDPYESNRTAEQYPSPPGKSNWFGTDDRGRDVLARLLYGCRYSLMFAVSVWILSYLAGFAAGGLMGYFGGKTDLIGQRVTEIMDCLPTLLVFITLTTALGKSFVFMVLFFSFMGWMWISFYIRAEFLRLRKRAFAEAARAQGRSHLSVLFKHIAPNALNPLITFSPFYLSAMISALAVLDYLGFGTPPPTPSWGELLSQAERHITTAWWLAVFPSLFLFLTLLALTFVGYGVRDAFDPREI